jgi:hypothetical protein
VIQPGDSLNVGITYNPTTVGSCSATLEITSNDPNESTMTLDLTGTGHELGQVPAALDIELFPLSDHVKKGKFVSYWVKVKNPQDTRHCFDYVTNITLPTGQIYPASKVFFGPFNVCLEPHTFIWEQINHRVSYGSLIGDHIYNAYIGDYSTLTIWNSDHFGFSIEK